MKLVSLSTARVRARALAVLLWGLGVGLLPGALAQTALPTPLTGMSPPWSAATPAAAPAAAPAPTPPLGVDWGAEDASIPAAAPRPPVSKPQWPSQFQRHVHELTGLWLPHFGAEFFERSVAQGYSVPASWAVAAPDDYVLGPGDQVWVRISGAVEQVTHQTIDRHGLITVPKVGTLSLAGVPLRQLEPLVRDRVAKVYAHVQVDVSLGKMRGITVYVVGHAQAPGAYTLPSLATLVNAVFASGGPNTMGSLRQITLRRAGNVVAELDVYAFVTQGDRAQDVALQSGDVISIPAAGPRVALTGATDHQAIFEIKPQTTVQDVLRVVGGIPALANARQILLERVQSDHAHAPRQVVHLPLSPEGLSTTLADGDVLKIQSARPVFANAVTLQGAVAEPMRHPWRPGLRISDVIPDAQALLEPDFYKRRQAATAQRLNTRPERSGAEQNAAPTPRPEVAGGREAALPRPSKAEGVSSAPDRPTSTDLGFPGREPPQGTGATPGREPRGWGQAAVHWDYALVQRLNKTTLKNEWIGFHLGKAVLQRDPAHDLLLEPDDVITVLSGQDLRLPAQRATRLVRIEGEVVTPGLYALRPGETLPELVLRAGGLTAQAYVFGTELTRESVRRQQQQNLDQLVGRLEAQMQSQSLATAANVGAERWTQAQTLVQVQQQQMQSQLARLKALRSKGRMSLELVNSAAQEPTPSLQQQMAEGFPRVPLEDGDAIWVPGRPGFVNALGSVNNENAILYRPGKTVADLVSAAGLSDEADGAQAFLLRADGSVVSRRHLGWLRSFDRLPLLPGDTLVVPPKLDRESGYSILVRGMRDWTQIFSNLGIGAAAIRTLRN